MSEFIINSNHQPNGDYEVHNKTTGCAWMPNQENQIALGSHLNCHGAISLAKTTYPQAAKKINGCKYCCHACHTS